MRSLFVLLALVGCQTSSNSTLSAEAEMLLSATNGDEEALASRASYGSADSSEDPDRPPLFRECNADGTWHEIYDSYDVNADQTLDESEQSQVQDAHGGRDPMEAQMADMRWRLMLLIYDLDEDGTLSDDERAAMFSDFTERCEVLSSALLEEFDTDGDGALSADEEQAAMDAMEAERESRRGEMEEHNRGEGRPEGDCGAPPEAGSRQVPPGLESYDADEDGTLSDAELSALRDALRARVRAGDPIVEPPVE